MKLLQINTRQRRLLPTSGFHRFWAF